MAQSDNNENNYKETILAKKNRILWIDFAKGIAIILVIIGHTVKNESILFAIYTFHMPLFFALSVMTYRLSASAQDLLGNIKRSFRHLIIPCIGLWLLHDILFLLAYHSGMDSIALWVRNRFLSFFFSSSLPIQLKGITVPSFGVLWFLIALFFGRTLFDVAYLYLGSVTLYLDSIIAIFCAMGVLLGKHVAFPFSLDYALAIQPFFLFGIRYNKRKNTPFSVKRLMIGISGCWPLGACITFCCPGDSLDIAYRQYPLFPICILMSCFALLAVSEICKWIVMSSETYCRYIVKSISFIGEHSFVLFGVHHMDGMWKKIYLYFDNNLVRIIIRLGIDIGVMLLLIAGWGLTINYIRNARCSNREVIKENGTK